MSARAKLPAALAALEHGLIERRRAVRLAFLAARVRQVDELRGQLAGYVDELEGCRRELDA